MGSLRPLPLPLPPSSSANSSSSSKSPAIAALNLLLLLAAAAPAPAYEPAVLALLARIGVPLPEPALAARLVRSPTVDCGLSSSSSPSSSSTTRGTAPSRSPDARRSRIECDPVAAGAAGGGGANRSCGLLPADADADAAEPGPPKSWRCAPACLSESGIGAGPSWRSPCTSGDWPALAGPTSPLGA